jgi:DNA-binding MarR family transcriptional regulator
LSGIFFDYFRHPYSKPTMNRPEDPPATRPERKALESRTFFISRVSTLNVLLKRRAAIYAKRAFGFTMIEWRIITLLPTLQPLSIRELAVHAVVDAAQVSRGLSQLEKKGYLKRERSPVDSRETLVSLTPSGYALSSEMYQASLRRNEQLLRENTPAEVDFLNSTLDALIERARGLVEADVAAEAARRRAAPRRRLRRPAAAGAEPAAASVS